MVVTAGAQQGLDLIAKVMVDPGDVIAIEPPAYVGALSAFGSYEPRYLQIDLDEDGMIVEQLEDALLEGRAPEVRLHRPELPQSRGRDHVPRPQRASRRAVPRGQYPDRRGQPLRPLAVRG
jgi:histidinol-phosphate/aromatic aminotransferase/cobyric acid decarboxylase-like protein